MIFFKEGSSSLNKIAPLFPDTEDDTVSNILVSFSVVCKILMLFL